MLAFDMMADDLLTQRNLPDASAVVSLQARLDVAVWTSPHGI